MSNIILFATANRHKVQEVQQILGQDYTVETPADHGILEDIPENEPSLEGNALFKARYVFERTGIPCFADDTGLEVTALNGAPGVYSARYAGESKDPQANMRKLTEALQAAPDRSARFRTAIAYVSAEEERLFEGIVEGHILQEQRGNEGFGYDPIFVPQGRNLTFAQMTAEEKNELSHRGRAMQKLIAFLNEKIN